MDKRVEITDSSKGCGLSGDRRSPLCAPHVQNEGVLKLHRLASGGHGLLNMREKDSSGEVTPPQVRGCVRQATHQNCVGVVVACDSSPWHHDNRSDTCRLLSSALMK